MIDNEKNESIPIIKDVPEMKEIDPGYKPPKTWLKIVLIILFIVVVIGMILAIVLSVMSLQNEKEEEKKEPEPPIVEKIFGKIICKYLLKEDTYSNILYEGFIPPKNFDVIIDGKKIEKYQDYKLNQTGEYNITYQIKQNNFSMSKMFTEVNNLISVEMISNGNCSLISIEQAFQNCKDLTHFSIKGFITSKLTSLKSLFCSTSLTTIDLQDFDTYLVEDMSYMFYGTKMKKLDLNFMSTRNVKNMEHMFSHCTELISLDISKFSTPKLEYMNNMFTHLESIKLLKIDNLDTSNVQDMSYLFADC